MRKLQEWLKANQDYQVRVNYGFSEDAAESCFFAYITDRHKHETVAMGVGDTIETAIDSAIEDLD